MHSAHTQTTHISASLAASLTPLLERLSGAECLRRHPSRLDAAPRAPRASLCVFTGGFGGLCAPARADLATFNCKRVRPRKLDHLSAVQYQPPTLQHYKASAEYRWVLCALARAGSANAAETHDLHEEASEQDSDTAASKCRRERRRVQKAPSTRQCTWE